MLIGLPDKLESNSVHLISGYHCSTSCLDFTRTLIYNEENPILRAFSEIAGVRAKFLAKTLKQPRDFTQKKKSKATKPSLTEIRGL